MFAGGLQVHDVAWPVDPSSGWVWLASNWRYRTHLYHDMVNGDLHHIHQILQVSQVARVNMFPRKAWQGLHNPMAIDRCRKKVKQLIHKIMQVCVWVCLCGIIPQPGIWFCFFLITSEMMDLTQVREIWFVFVKFNSRNQYVFQLRMGINMFSS